VIVPEGIPAALAAKAATTTIPIVFQIGADPVNAGLVASLNRPGGKITGITNLTTTLAAKRLELLHRLVPRAATIGVLIDPTQPSSTAQRSELGGAASALGLQLMFLNSSNEHEIDAAFATFVQRTPNTKQASTSRESSKVRIQATFRSNNRPNSSLPSTSRRPRRLASPSRKRCWPQLTW
jgi:ABC-type uncharacterized transport system substrate-binding protein